MTFIVNERRTFLGAQGNELGVAEAPTTDFEQAVDMCIDTVERRKDDQVARLR